MAAMFKTREEAMAWLKNVKARKKAWEEHAQIILEEYHNERIKKAAIATNV